MPEFYIPPPLIRWILDTCQTRRGAPTKAIIRAIERRHMSDSNQNWTGMSGDLLWELFQNPWFVLVPGSPDEAFVVTTDPEAFIEWMVAHEKVTRHEGDILIARSILELMED